MADTIVAALACLACFGFDHPTAPMAAIDLGTNGEVMVTNGSTAFLNIIARIKKTRAAVRECAVALHRALHEVVGLQRVADLGGLHQRPGKGDHRGAGRDAEGRVGAELVDQGIGWRRGRREAQPQADRRLAPERHERGELAAQTVARH